MRIDRRLLAENVTLADVARAVGADARPFVLTGRWAGGSTIAGSAPLRTVADDADPFAALEDLPAVAASPVAFGGGWVGLLGFALGAQVEALPPSPAPRGATTPAHRLAFYDHVLVLDAAGRCWLEWLALPGRRAAVAARGRQLRDRLAEPSTPAPWRVEELAVLPPGARGHEQAVDAVIDRIAAGEIFQANLSLRLAGRLHGSPLEAWLALMERAPSAYGAYLGWEDGAVLSASPELFLHRRGRRVRTRPMKGTRARTGPGDDAARELASSAKDAAENVMIVDLMRNDLGRVCAYGTIEVGQPEVEAHPGVWQLVREVSGTLRDDVGDGTLVRACFPPGSVVGAPKVQALKVIAAEEATARGAHCGAIGYVSPHAGLELNVAIRTLEVAGRQLSLGVGGGIVADSVAADERRECLIKAAPLLRALDAALAPAVPALDAAPPALEAAPPALEAEAPALEAEAPAPDADLSCEGPVPGADRFARGDGAPSPGPAALLGTAALLGRADARPDPAAGIFETVRLAAGGPVALDAHLARLRRSAGILRGTEPDLAVAAEEVRALAREGAAAARIIAVPGARGWTVTVLARPAPAPVTEPVVLLPVVLPGGLGEHKWADRSALRVPPGRDAPAAWLLCDRGGEVLEAAWANVWLREGDRLVTPPADGRLLGGIQRAAILADPHLAGGRSAAQERIDLARLAAADAVLLSSSLRIVPAVLDAACSALPVHH